MARKGEKLDTKTIEEAKISKHANLLSKMKWEIADPFLDVELCQGSANRSKKHMTLREYKEQMQSGITQETMRKNGISKHLIQFMSNFCQGKIKLTKEQFAADYLAGTELEDIAKKYDIPREDTTKLRQLYGIIRIGGGYSRRKENEIPITQRQREIIYGSLLGDAKKMSNASVGFGQGSSQREYLMWKYNEMYSIASKDSLKRYPYIDPRSGYEGESWRFYTHANSDVEKIITEFYRDGNKEISQNILNNLSALSVAVWFMDDGKTDMRFRFIEKDGGNHTPVPEFCTECFSHESCLLSQKCFKEKWNISTRLREKKLKNGLGYRIIIENESVECFFDLIRPYIIPSMLYKINYKEYVNKREKFI